MTEHQDRRQRAEQPDEIDDAAAERALDRVLAKPPTRAERDWYLDRPKPPR
jgi:hypothetical protein